MITKEMEKRYIDAMGDFCPYCHSDNIEAGEWYMQGAYQDVHCKTCGKTWHDVYELTRINEPV